MIFHEELRKFVLVFFDEIHVYSKSWEEHLKHLKMIFTILDSNSLFAKLLKCECGSVELSYLRHKIFKFSVVVEPDKVATIENWLLPSTVKVLRGFLGLTGYYR